MTALNNRLVTPSNIDAEKALIATVLLTPDVMYDKQLKPEWFYKPELKEVASVILKLFVEGKPISTLSIKEYLRTDNKLDTVGGEVFVDNLPFAEFNSSHIDYYIDLIRSAHTLRNIIGLGQICTDTGYNPTIKADAAKERVSKAYDLLMSDDDVKNTYSMDELADQEFKDLNFRIEHPDSVGISTGFENYDLLTGGFRPTNMVIVAGRPGMGKTAWMLKALLNVGERGVPSYIVEKEMGRSELMQRLVAIKSGVDLLKIRNGTLNQKEYNSVVSSLKILKSLPIYIEADSTLNIFDIVTRVRKMVRTQGVKVFAVDHVQLLLSSAENETAELSYVSRTLKNLGMELEVTGLILSQLNRNLEGRSDKRPQLSDLKQSGSLEQDADIVNFLYRDEVYDKKSGNEGMAEFIIAKHRNGPTGTVPMIFRAPTADYVSI